MRSRRAVAFIAATVLALSISGLARADDLGEEPDYGADEIQARYDLLIDELVEATMAADEVAADEVIDEMSAAGFEFLSDDEVDIRFPGVRQSLEAQEQVGPDPGDDIGVIRPQVAVPRSGKYTWKSTRVLYTYKGTTYEIQTLTATPTNKSSKLRHTGNKTFSSRDVRTAVAQNLIRVAIGAASGKSPYTAFAYSIYDVASGVMKDLRPSTTVTNVTASYTWVQATTAQFKFVKKKGESDSRQMLTYASTKSSAEVAWSIPTIDTKDGQVTPRVIQGKRFFASTPSCYGSNYEAVRSWGNPMGRTQCYAGSITMTGVAGKALGSIPAPTFPWPAALA